MVYHTPMKNWLCQQYAVKAAYTGALTALGTGGAVGTEPSGGSPAYARVASGWGTASSGSINSSAVLLNMPSGVTIVGTAVYDVASGTPSYYDQTSVPTTPFSSVGTLTVTSTYVQQ